MGTGVGRDATFVTLASEAYPLATARLRSSTSGAGRP